MNSKKYNNISYNLFYNGEKIGINIPIDYGTNYLNEIRTIILSHKSNINKNFVFLDKNNNIIKKESENSIYLALITNNNNINIKEEIKKYYFRLKKKIIFDDKLNPKETLSNIRKKYKKFIPDEVIFLNSKKEKIYKKDENSKKIEEIVIKNKSNNNIENMIDLQFDKKKYKIYINKKCYNFYFFENSSIFDIRYFLENNILDKNTFNLPFLFLNTNKNYEVIDEKKEKNIEIKEITNEKNEIIFTNKLIENSKYITIQNNINDFLFFQYPEEIYKKEIKESDDINNIIVFGQTGSGKTTLINRLTNFMNQIKFEDKIKYKLVLEINIENGSSLTKFINKYFIEKKFNDNKKNYNKIKSMIIIDTPGFGDNNDINVDFNISKMAKEIFEKIKKISAVIFVINKNDLNINNCQYYIFDSVFNLFGNDIINNIFFFITHCDNDLKEIEKDRIDNNLNCLLKKFLKKSIEDLEVTSNTFNNYVAPSHHEPAPIYYETTNISTENNHLATETTKNVKDKDKNKKIYYISNFDKKKNWDDSEKEYLRFFNYLNEIEKIDLKSTIDNLKNREILNESSEKLVSIIKKFNEINNKLKKNGEIKFNKTLNNKNHKSYFDVKHEEMEKLIQNFDKFNELNISVKEKTKKLKEKCLNKNLFYPNKEYITTEFINREDYKNREKIKKYIKGIEVLKTIGNDEDIEEIKEVKVKVKKEKDNKILKEFKNLKNKK